jgi:hypothetical protein
LQVDLIGPLGLDHEGRGQRIYLATGLHRHLRHPPADQRPQVHRAIFRDPAQRGHARKLRHAGARLLGLGLGLVGASGGDDAFRGELFEPLGTRFCKPCRRARARSPPICTGSVARTSPSAWPRTTGSPAIT